MSTVKEEILTQIKEILKSSAGIPHLDVTWADRSKQQLLFINPRTSKRIRVDILGFMNHPVIPLIAAAVKAITTPKELEAQAKKDGIK